MKQPAKYDFKIDSGHLDFQGNISPIVLADLIVAASAINADEQGLGIVDLHAKNYSWVISRFAMEVDVIPTMGDKLSVETWVRDVGGVFTTRNFRLTNESENGDSGVIGYANITWAVLDLDTRRSLPMDKVPEIARHIIEEDIPMDHTSRIPDIEGEVANGFEVKYSDIDLNVHTNFLKYLEATCNVFSLDFYSKRTLKRVEINFLRELSFGDKGNVYYEEMAKNDFLFKLVTSEGVVASRSRMVFENKE